ncbi:MAG: hypothetical protein QM704_13115 [Anaeromyxobacteraceae bacterium]
MIAAAALALALGAPSLALDLSVRAEARSTRLSPLLESLSPQTRQAGELTPTVGATLEGHAFRLRTTYAPRLWSPEISKHANLDHRLLLRGDAAPHPDLHLTLVGGLVRSVLDPLADAWTDFSPYALPPTSEVQHILDARAQADVALRFGPRTVATLRGFIGDAKGLDAQSRLVLPPQRDRGLSLFVDQGVTVRDQLSVTTEVRTARTWPVNGPARDADFALAGLRWERRLAPLWRGIASAGVYGIREGTDGEPAVTGLAPSGELTFVRDPDRSGITVSGGLRFAPDIDRVTGAVRKAFTATTAVGWRLGPDWGLGAGLNAAASSPPDEPVLGFDGVSRRVWEPLAVGTELRVTRRLEDGIDLEGGLRWRWNQDHRSIQGSFREVGAFLGVTWAAVPERASALTPPPALQRGAP